MRRKIRSGGKPMTAIVLAGGRGSRMRTDKAGLAVGARTLLEHVVGQIEPYFEEVLISVSPGQNFLKQGGSPQRPGSRRKNAATGEKPGFRVLVDEIPGLGPVGGILSGLRAAANGVCAVVACDIPDIDIPLLRSLARAAEDTEIAVPVDPAGRFEPLFAVYRRTVIPRIEDLIGSGERSVLPLYDVCRTAVIRLDDACRLRNLNTRADYRDYLKSLRSN